MHRRQHRTRYQRSKLLTAWINEDECITDCVNSIHIRETTPSANESFSMNSYRYKCERIFMYYLIENTNISNAELDISNVDAYIVKLCVRGSVHTMVMSITTGNYKAVPLIKELLFTYGAPTLSTAPKLLNSMFDGKVFNMIHYSYDTECDVIASLFRNPLFMPYLKKDSYTKEEKRLFLAHPEGLKLLDDIPDIQFADYSILNSLCENPAAVPMLEKHQDKITVNIYNNPAAMHLIKRALKKYITKNAADYLTTANFRIRLGIFTNPSAMRYLETLSFLGAGTGLVRSGWVVLNPSVYY